MLIVSTGSLHLPDPRVCTPPESNMANLSVLEVGEGDLEDTALEGVVGVLQTAGAVDQSLADTL
jgi:hypothetical protein